MKTQTSLNKIAANFCLAGLAAVMLTGCASTKVANREILVTEKLPRPGHIWVYNFTTSPAEVPAASALAGKPAVPQTAEQITEAQQVGSEIANELATQISALGLPGVVAWSGTQPAVNDIVIRGYLLSVDEGSEVKRMALGFGSGSSKLKVAVEGFQMTPTGLRKLGSGDVNSGGGKGPGMAVGAAVFLATANPVGLIVGSGVKIYGEASGKSKISGRAEATVKEIMTQVEPRFKAMGWID